MRGWTMAVMLLLATALHAQYYKIELDPKTAAMIEANKKSAEEQEKKYTQHKDTVAAKKKLELMYVTTRNGMKMLEKSQREYFGDLNGQGYAFVSMVNECKKIAAAATNTVSLAQKYGLGTWKCARNVAEVLTEAEETVKETIRIAFNGKVPNPFNKNIKVSDDGLSVTQTGPVHNLEVQDRLSATTATPGGTPQVDKSKLKTDGYNLLLADDRVRMVNTCVYRLRTLRRSLEVLNFKMRCTYTIRDALREAVPYDYYWTLGMENSINSVKNRIKNMPW